MVCGGELRDSDHKWEQAYLKHQACNGRKPQISGNAFQLWLRTFSERPKLL